MPRTLGVHPCFFVYWLSICFLSGQVLSDDSNVAYWQSPRANLLGDSIYINGGDLFVNESQYPEQRSFGAGLLGLRLNSSHIFSGNLSVLELAFQPDYLSEPNFYVGGAMFASSDGLMTYG